MRFLLIFFMFLTINLLGQNSPKEKTTSEVLGEWKFKPYYEKFDDGEKSFVSAWLVMEISFSPQRRFKFVLYDSATQEGKWDISEDGKTLLLSERSQTPEYHEKLLPLNFPIKTKKGKYIKLIFRGTETIDEKEGKEKDKEIEFRPVK
jgi:hypothetical protein